MARASVFDRYATRYDHLRLEREDGILQVTLHNAGSDFVWASQPHRELGLCFGDIAADADNQVVILTGSGDTFIDRGPFGPDGTDMKSENDGIALDANTLFEAFHAAKALWMNHLGIDAPMIAAVNGNNTIHAEISLLCDIVLSVPDAEFGDAPHFPKGVVPGDGVHILWPTLIGLNRARYMLLTGQTIPATEGQRLGFVNEIVARPDLLDRAWELARMIIARPPATVRFSRPAMLQALKQTAQEQLSHGLALEFLAGTAGRWPFH